MSLQIAQDLKLPGGGVLKNRLAKGAMSEQLASPDGAPDERMLRLYEQWGAGGSGLLITGHVMLDSAHCSERGNVIIEDERHLEQLKRWARAGTQDGTQLWMQINHPGRQTPRNVDPNPVSASAVPMDVASSVFAPPRALADSEIRDLIGRFATAAAVAEKAGFNGVQIHSAHGYLVSQFLSPITNQRTDEWGGDAARRRRFLLEIVRAIRAAVGPRFAVAVKLNSADFQRGGFSEAESLAVIEALSDEGIDLLEISGGTYSRAVMFAETTSESTKKREAFFLDFAERARSHSKVPLMLTGGFRSLEGMESALASGAVDVIGMARPLAIEPGLPAALLSGASTAALPIRLGTGFKTLDSAMVGAWYQHQIGRMGRGKPPNPSMGRLAALAQYVVNYMRQGKPSRRSPVS